MPDIVVNDLNPRVQFVATGFEANFPYNFPIFAPTDLKVYMRATAATLANDAAQILRYNIDYTVTNNVAPAIGGIITPINGLFPTIAGQIWTIIRDMPDDRLVNYTDGGTLSATGLNTDFDRTVMMNQQNKMYLNAPGSVGVRYNYDDTITNIVDNILPVLPPNTVWMKNANNTAIVATTIPGGGGGGGAQVILPSVPNTIAQFTNNTGTIQSTGVTITGNNIFTSIIPNIGFQFISNGAGVFQIGGLTYPSASVGAGFVLTDDGAGHLTLQPPVPPLQVTVTGLNMLINGDMQIGQRGAGGAAVFAINAGNAYTLDRWQAQSGAVTNITVTQTPGATSGSFLARIQRNAANAGVGLIQFGQSLIRDMCIGAAGSRVTLSFKARVGANFSSAGGILNATIWTGTGAVDVSEITTGFVGAVAVSNLAAVPGAVFANFTITTPVLAANVTMLSVVFSYTGVGIAGANDYFDVTDVQLEIGNTQTAFMRLDFEQQLIRSMRFYQKTFAYGTLPAVNTGNQNGSYSFPANIAGASINTASSFPFFTPVLTANAGNFTFFSPDSAANQFRNRTRNQDCTVTVLQGINEKSFLLACTASGGTVVGDQLAVHWTYENDVV